MSAKSFTLNPEAAHSVALVGNVVTWANRQWTVHSVEGDTWHAMRQGDQVNIATGLTPTWITDPVAALTSSDYWTDLGPTTELAPVGELKRGICLVKAYR